MEAVTFDVENTQMVTVYFKGGNNRSYSNLKKMETSKGGTLMIEYAQALGVKSVKHVARINMENVDVIDVMTKEQYGEGEG